MQNAFLCCCKLYFSTPTPFLLQWAAMGLSCRKRISLWYVGDKVPQIPSKLFSCGRTWIEGWWKHCDWYHVNNIVIWKYFNLELLWILWDCDIWKYCEQYCYVEILWTLRHCGNIVNNIVIGARCDLITFKRGIGAIHGTISITRGKTNLLQKKILLQFLLDQYKSILRYWDQRVAN